MKKNIKIDSKILKELLMCVIGAVVHVIGMVVFIMPCGLYSGGMLGISQILAKLVGIPKVQALAYFILNVFCVLLGIRSLGKKFVLKTGCVVLAETLLFAVVPNLDVPVMDDVFACTVIGGCVCGFGTAIVFNSFSSSGGTDIIGMLLARKYNNITVGSVSNAFNAFVYAAAAILFSPEIAIYSIAFSFVASVVSDRMHRQNNVVSVYIFCEKWREINEYITGTLNRGATDWMGAGAYSDEMRHIVFTTISVYEFDELKENIGKIDDTAFIVANSGARVVGEFKKKIS